MKHNKQKKRGIGSMLHLMKYLLKYKVNMLFLLISMLISNIAGLCIPKFSGDMINEISNYKTGISYKHVLMFTIEIIIAALVSWIFTYFQNNLMVKTGQHVIADIRNDVFDRLEHLPVSYFDGTTKGNLMSIVVNDINNVSDTICADIVHFITGAVVLTGSLIMMLDISPLLSTVFIVTVPAMIICTVVISKKARRYHHDKKNAFGTLCGYTEEMINAQKTVKVYGIEDENNQDFDYISNDYKKKGIKADYCSGRMMPALTFINNVNFTFICGLSVFLVLSGQITIGNVQSFILYSKKFASPVIDISNIISMLQACFAACDRIFGILNTPPEENNENKLSLSSDTKGDIVFDHVGFSYDEENPVLRDIDFHIRPGHKIAVVGSTGAGKTTLISLLLRFYNLTKGRILIDGVDISQVSLEELRRCFALVLQDSWLFEGSIYDNIVYALPEGEHSREKVTKLCKDIEVDDFISCMPKGYDTIMHNQSGGLSQGQKQLINIARAFLCNPSIFIFDEATSSVDPQTEQKIQDVTNKVIQGKTSIIIAHRLSTILTADCILVMDNGYIKEFGNHEELLKQNGLYKSIFESQFQS